MVVDDDKLYIALEPTAGSPVSLYTVSLVGDGHVSKAAQYPATFAMQPLPLGSCGDLLLVAVSSGVVVLRKTPLGLIEVGRELYIDWHSSWVLRVDQVTCQVVIRTESGLLTITPHCDVSSIRAVSIVQGNGMASVLGDALLFAREDGVGIAWVDRHLQLQHALLHRVVGGVTTVVGARESGYYAFGTSTTATVYICSINMLECSDQPLITNTANSTTLFVTDTSIVTADYDDIRLQPKAGVYPEYPSLNCTATRPPLFMTPRWNLDTYDVIRDGTDCDIYFNIMRVQEANYDTMTVQPFNPAIGDNVLNGIEAAASLVFTSTHTRYIFVIGTLTGKPQRQVYIINTTNFYQPELIALPSLSSCLVDIEGSVSLAVGKSVGVVMTTVGMTYFNTTAALTSPGSDSLILETIPGLYQSHGVVMTSRGFVFATTVDGSLIALASDDSVLALNVSHVCSRTLYASRLMYL
jgi:hypothetical protein